MEHGELLSAGGMQSEPGQPRCLPEGNGFSWHGHPSSSRLGEQGEANYPHMVDRVPSSTCIPPRINSEPTLETAFPTAFSPSPSVPIPQQRRLHDDPQGIPFTSLGNHPPQFLATHMQSTERCFRDTEASPCLAERTKMWGAVSEPSSSCDENKRMERTPFSQNEQTVVSRLPNDLPSSHSSFSPPTCPSGPPHGRDMGLTDVARQGGSRGPTGELLSSYRGHPSLSPGSPSAPRQHARDPDMRPCSWAGHGHSEQSTYLADTRREGSGHAPSAVVSQNNTEGLQHGQDPVGPRVSTSSSGSRNLDSVSHVRIPEKLQCEPQVVETVITVPRVRYEQKITEVPQVMVRERIVEVPQIVRKEKVVTVPKIEIQEKIIEAPVIRYLEKVVEVPQRVIEEKFVSIDEVIRQEKIIPIPKIEVVEKIIQTPKIIQVEKIIDVPRIEYREVEVEKIVEVPQIQIQYVERDVPVPQKVVRHVPVDKIVEVRQKKIVEKIVKIPVPRYIEVPKYIEQPVPREKIVRVEKKIERKVPTPQPQDTYQEVEKPVYVTKYIERRVPVPTERIVEEHFQVEVPREVIVKKPYDVIRRVEKQVEVAVPFVSGEPLILTADGYIPFQEFAEKSQMLTPKDRHFYERQSEALGAMLPSAWDKQTNIPSPSGSFTSTSETGSCRGAQARLPEEEDGKGASSSIGGSMQTAEQSAYPVSPLNSPTSHSTCSGLQNPSHGVN